MRTMLSGGCLALTVLTTACATTVQPPAPAPVPQDAYIHAPYDAVWSSAVQYFADTRIPISTIDKASGLMASKDFSLSGDLIVRWVTCANKDGSPREMRAENTDRAMAGGFGRAYADFNVFLRPAGDSTLVRVNPYIRVEARGFSGWTPANCVSNGVFDRELVEYIRAHAK